MVDAPADGTGGSGGSGGGKRPSSPSSSPPSKRSKAEVTAKGDADTGKCKEDAPVAAEPLLSWKSPLAAAPQRRVPWARLVSHKQQVQYSRPLIDNECYVGSGEQCQIFVKDTSLVLCKLKRLEVPDKCELEVTGEGLVKLNGSKISAGELHHLSRGDKIAFGNLAYIFQPVAVPMTATASQAFKDRLKQQILCPDAIQDTFDNFPYYLSENTKKELLSPSVVHMGKKFRHMEKELTNSLSLILSLNPRILLSGPSGSDIYQEKIIKALAKNFGARLLIVDSLLMPGSSADHEVESLGVDKLMEVISEESISRTLIVLVKDVDNTLSGSRELRVTLGDELPHGVLIIGSHTEKDSPYDKELIPAVPLSGFRRVNRRVTRNYLNSLFPNKVSIELPEDEHQLSDLHKLFRLDAENIRVKENALNLRKFLTHRGMECASIEELPIKDRLLTHDEVDKVVGSALSYHLLNNKPDIPEDANLVLPTESLRHGLSGLNNMNSSSSEKALKDLAENQYERNLLSYIIEPDNTGVSFADIGALENVKEMLHDLIITPLKRPELFSRSPLLKTVKGILFFGPPGTGKTMLAKAVATESGATFISISMSSIMTKWLGDGEKYMKAVFSLASKAAPSIIFIDEVDSMLGKRGSLGEQETTRRMKNEFMVHWDGLRTKDKERVLVLAATNRPFDLDEASIRRFTRRLMVNLPDASSRERILKQILSTAKLAPGFDFQSLANMTDGFSGSDLKNLCVTAAHRRIRELLDREKEEARLARDEGRPEPALLGIDHMRPLSMGDLKFALDQVSASSSSDSKTWSALIEWNTLYGDGGSKLKTNLSYFM